MDEFRYFTETVAPAAAKQLYQAMGCPQTDPEETERKRTLAEQRNALCELIGCPVRYALIETPMPLLACFLLVEAVDGSSDLPVDEETEGNTD